MTRPQMFASTPDGPVYVGDFVQYHGSLVCLRGQILEAVRRSEIDGLVLRTATGNYVKHVRASSISPIIRTAA